MDADKGYDWPDPLPRLVIYHFGINWKIMQLLTDQGFNLFVVPSCTTAA